VPTTLPPDPATQELALSGTLHAEDFMPPWTQYAPGAAATVDEGSCAYRPGGAVTHILPGGIQSGPTMQYGDTGAYASSFTVVFPEVAQAQEYIGVVSTDVWGTCKAAEYQQFQHDNGHDDITVSVTSRTNETLGQSGFEAYAEFSLADAAGNVSRIVVTSFYRLERTVIVVTEEYGSLNDADSAGFFDGTFAALTAAYHRVNAVGAG
jgi:hypothetical protein